MANGEVIDNLVTAAGFYTIQIGMQVLRTPLYETKQATTDIVIGHDIVSRLKEYQ